MRCGAASGGGGHAVEVRLLDDAAVLQDDEGVGVGGREKRREIERFAAGQLELESFEGRSSQAQRGLGERVVLDARGGDDVLGVMKRPAAKTWRQPVRQV